MADGEITVTHRRRWAGVALAAAALGGVLALGVPPAVATPAGPATKVVAPGSSAFAGGPAGQTHTVDGQASTAPAVRPNAPASRLLPLALAGPPTYEIEGEWIVPPVEIASGDPVVAQWRVNVNDSLDPPGNDPIADVTATFTLQNATFDGIPDICKTAGVTTPSNISADGLTLSCNFGTVNAGTAISLQTPVLANGPTGGLVDITGSIGGQTASPAEIPINNPFGMDIRWGPPTTFQDVGDGYRDMDFEWTLSLNRGSDPGPQTIVYNLTISSAQASPIVVGPQACSPYSIDPTTADHPWSGGTHPADRMASFVTSCTLTQTGPTTFQLTLNGINYAPANPPTRSSSGDLLPTDRTVVASGSIWIRLTPTQGSGSVQLTSDAPFYAPATSGPPVQDDPANNTSSKTWVGPGIYSSGWMRAYTGNAGTTWDDTYRVTAGAVVASYMDTALQLHTDRPDNYPVGMCTALDTRYVTYTGFEWWPSRPTVAGAVVEYYTGGDPTLDPASGSYDPNAFYCGGTGGWSTTPPADLSQVRAFRITFTQGQAEQYSYSAGLTVTVFQQIKPDTPTGADVWTAFSGIVDFPGVSDYWNGTPCVTPTPGLRYSCTTGFHDLVRIVSAAPSIQKSTGDSSVTPGVPEAYTLTYSANGFGTLPPTIDGFTIVDTLPLGMTYVPGSATPAPVLSTDPQNRQVLTWTLNGVPTNTELTLMYQAVADASVAPGTPLTNTVSASYDGSTTRPATATVVTSTNGYTTILKTADDQQVQLDGTGTATLPWTVTVRSFDPIAQAFTDTIDVLPYNGDGRGTAFSGTAALDSVVAPGATVYYTTAAPATLTDDPADPANGAAGDPTGNTVGWTTTPPVDLTTVTAIRVIGPSLPAGGTFAFQVVMETADAEPGDVYVNRSQAIAEHTGLVMRTSAMIELYEDVLVKDLAALVRNADGTYTAAFTISTTRSGNGPGYDLSDTLQYGDSVTLVGPPTAANAVPGDGSVTVVNAWNGGTATLTIAADVPIPDGVTHEYTVTSIVSVDGDTVSLANTDCTLTGGETGTGLQNTATLGVEDVEQTATDCAELPYTIHEKSVTGGPTPNGDGTYAVEYTIDVRNLGAAPDVYDLADDFRFGSAVTILGTPASTNTVPGGIDPLDTWDSVTTTLAIVDDEAIAAATVGGPTVHTYVVTVQVAVDAPAVTFGNSDCSMDGGESGTGLFNETTLTVDSFDDHDDACVPISEPVHVKAVVPGSPTPLGDGTYRVDYTITVTNAGAAASAYDLNDQFQFGSAVTIVGTPEVSATVPPGLPQPGTWDEPTTTLAITTGEAIAAGTSAGPATHTYTVTVIVDVDAAAVTFANSDCTVDAGESGTGLRNASTMTVNGESTEQAACPPISEPVHTKTVSSGPTPLGNNQFQVDYAITVTNAGATASQYDLTDDFQFGPAVTIVGIPTVTNTVPGDIATLGTWNAGATTLDIVADQAIDGGTAGGPATHTYIVSVVVTADLPLATPSNSDCMFDQGEDGTGLFNQTTLAVNGDEANDDACLEFPRPIIDHTKTLTGVTPNGDGTYTVGYSVAVTNNGAGAGIYDLTDTLQYGTGVEVVGQPTVTADPGTVALIPGWNGTSATGLADDQPIDPVTTHTYTLTVVVRPDPGTTIGGATDCTLDGGESGTGVRNESHLTAPGGVDQVRNACGELPHFVIDKAITTGPTDLGNGQYQLGYTITVTNDGAEAGTYDLTDHLTYGSSVTITSVAIANTAPGGIGLNPGWNGTSDTTVVTGVGLGAGGTHIYTVTVTFAVAVGASDTANDCTLEPGESGTGLLNTATVNNNGSEHSGVACALVLPPPPPPTTTVPPPATPAPTVPPTLPDPGQLPATGGDSTPIGRLAVGFVLLGGLVLAVTRRRRRPSTPIG